MSPNPDIASVAYIETNRAAKIICEEHLLEVRAILLLEIDVFSSLAICSVSLYARAFLISAEQVTSGLRRVLKGKGCTRPVHTRQMHSGPTLLVERAIPSFLPLAYKICRMEYTAVSARYAPYNVRIWQPVYAFDYAHTYECTRRPSGRLNMLLHPRLPPRNGRRSKTRTFTCYLRLRLMGAACAILLL